MADSAKINLSIDPSVTSIAFADNSSSSWGNGKIIITGFKDDVISFGNNASGLTTSQLSKLDIGETALEIDASGKIKSEAPPEVSVSTFTNGGGDKLWSNPLNWNNGIPNIPTAKVTLNDSLILDKDVSIAQIKLANIDKGVAVTSSNNSKLTLTAAAAKNILAKIVQSETNYNAGNTTYLGINIVDRGSAIAYFIETATIPGRSVIGIVLPNSSREKVFLKELLSSKS